MSKTFIVSLRHGANWDASLGPREQPRWAEHATFMDALFERGTVILGGPLADGSGSVVIVEASQESEVWAWFLEDPWTIHDVLLVHDVKQWHIFLDSRRKGETEPAGPGPKRSSDVSLDNEAIQGRRSGLGGETL